MCGCRGAAALDFTLSNAAPPVHLTGWRLEIRFRVEQADFGLETY